MAVYKSDQQDILFNLNDVLNISQHEQYGFDATSVKEIIIECDKFVENEVFPTRQKSDEFGVELTDSGVKVSPNLHKLNKAFYEMGWYALGMPENIDGSPAPEGLVAACRSLAPGANVAWSMYPGLTKGAMNVMHLVGDDYIKNTYVPKIMSGTWGGTMCLTEAGAGSDVGNLKATAAPIEGKEGWYKIKGTKIFISSGDNDLYENNIHLVLARTPEGEAGTRGISLFVVPKLRVNEDGTCGVTNDVNCTQVEHKMGIHASATCVLNFGDANECEGYLIGKEFEGMQNMFIMMNEARLDCGMQGESQANLAYELTKQYVQERVQFNTEIVNHADVKKNLLKMRAMTRGLRSIILYTADLFDQAHKDEKYNDYIGILTPICKSFASEQGFNVAVEAVQAHGGYGYCSEYGVEQFVRDIKIATIYEGTNGIQAIDFVMRKILKDQGAVFQQISKEILTTMTRLTDDFSIERETLQKALGTAQSAMEFIATHAKSKKMGIVLQSCKDFLDLSAHIVVSWRLMESALVAKEKMTSANDEEKVYLETKLVDFKIYTTQHLAHSVACARAITSLTEDVSSYTL
ncbi:acyl-CoA dehydrogenase [Candidatus Falkowbacteria bacterium]|nr:acyl-CoA dehydrogenase [Candidatus Falkowbacteria bacterium]